MAIFWRDSMSVANASIDKDHRYLICMINTVELSLQNPDHKEILTDALEQLDLYTKEHFRREEKLQTKLNYPHHMVHLKKHHELINAFKGIKQNILENIDHCSRENDVEDLIELLRHWLLDHVLQEDLQMKAYFSKFPYDFT